MAVRHLSGALTECGCWRGLSMLVLCLSEQTHSPNFAGEDVHVFDSFEGLSAPGIKDLRDVVESEAG